MKYNINIWSVQWIESDESENFSPIVEIHLSYDSAMSRIIELTGHSKDSFEEFRGYPTKLVGGISMSAYKI